jgi:hypothetical protein
MVKKTTKKKTTGNTKKNQKGKGVDIDSKKIKKVVNKEINRVRRQFKLKFKDWIADVVKVIKNPRGYFSSIEEDGNYEDPIVRAGFYGFIAGAFALLFYVLDYKFNVSGLLYLIAYPAIAIVMTFGFAGVMLLFAYICRGDMDFEFSVKAVSTKMFIYPLAIVLNGIAFSMIYLYIVYVVLALYILFLMYNAVIYSLHGDKSFARGLFSILAVAIALLLLSEPGQIYIRNSNQKVFIKDMQREIADQLKFLRGE